MSKYLQRSIINLKYIKKLILGEMSTPRHALLEVIFTIFFL